MDKINTSMMRTTMKTLKIKTSILKLKAKKTD
jgi:hypothetical protein